MCQAVLTDLREVIVRATGKEPVESAAKTLDYVASLCTHLIKQQNYDSNAWNQVRPRQPSIAEFPSTPWGQVLAVVLQTMSILYPTHRELASSTMIYHRVPIRIYRLSQIRGG